jgi:SSS family solute:Na+ symporter
VKSLFSLSSIDLSIIVIYFAFVLGIGFLLKRYMKTSKDFFLSGRSMPGWVAGLAFLSANLGALEILGMTANSYQHGIQTVHFYWIGAIPAMLFLAIFMMPFYYGSKVRSVPEYLSLRYNEATRGLNAVSFAVMTVLMSGISLYSMAIIFRILLGWDLHTSIFLSAGVVLIYVVLGGLTSSIFNEVIQFFLIWLGLLPLPLLGLKMVGGFNGLAHGIQNSTIPHVQQWAQGFLHAWSSLGSTTTNSVGVDWLGTALGLGFVLSFGYWCTDFLVVQRAFAAEDLPAAQRAPIYATFFKMLVPFLVVTPGLLAVVLLPPLSPEADQLNSYNMALPLLMQKFYPPGMIGLGLTALLASFMSGMAGNVTAFTTVWTYDIYQPYLNPKASEKHYVLVGRIATVLGVLISIGTAYIVMDFKTIMDYMQVVFSCVNAPLFATFLLGMFWRRATGWGGFVGLLSGILAALLMFMGGNWVPPGGLLHKWNILAADPTAMGATFWRAWYAWLTCFGVTILVSLFGKPKPKEELQGVVYGLEDKAAHYKSPWYNHPVFLAVVSGILLLILDIIFF